MGANIVVSQWKSRFAPRSCIESPGSSTEGLSQKIQDFGLKNPNFLGAGDLRNLKLDHLSSFGAVADRGLCAVRSEGGAECQRTLEANRRMPDFSNGAAAVARARGRTALGATLSRLSRRDSRSDPVALPLSSRLIIPRRTLLLLAPFPLQLPSLKADVCHQARTVNVSFCRSTPSPMYHFLTTDLASKSTSFFFSSPLTPTPAMPVDLKQVAKLFDDTLAEVWDNTLDVETLEPQAMEWLKAARHKLICDLERHFYSLDGSRHTPLSQPLWVVCSYKDKRFRMEKS
ncbi:hypothetical protein B0H11DRAFT_1923996 [Mycena galericulata]|nr:hypothetical protein B0H11DRAFT_1923996 [Mycena galericulata]